MIVTQDSTTMTTGTGTTGDTILTGGGSNPSSAIQVSTGGVTIFVILFLAGVIAHLLDRRFRPKTRPRVNNPNLPRRPKPQPRTRSYNQGPRGGRSYNSPSRTPNTTRNVQPQRQVRSNYNTGRSNSKGSRPNQ